jgi:hypothetical protein
MKCRSPAPPSAAVPQRVPACPASQPRAMPAPPIGPHLLRGGIKVSRLAPSSNPSNGLFSTYRCSSQAIHQMRGILNGVFIPPGGLAKETGLVTPSSRCQVRTIPYLGERYLLCVGSNKCVPASLILPLLPKVSSALLPALAGPRHRGGLPLSSGPARALYRKTLRG